MTNGIVFDLKRYTLHDGPGIRMAVHVKGCPLRCAWCHNPESQSHAPEILVRPDRCIGCGKCLAACPQGAIPAGAGFLITDETLCDGCGRCADVCPAEARQICGRAMTPDDVLRAAERERLFFEQSGGGVTLTGGEPLASPDFTVALLRACKAREFHTALDTCGFAPYAALEATIPYTDLYLYDVKHMDPEAHKRYTGVDNDVILTNLRRLGEAGAAIYARMPFIPGANTDEQNLHAMGKFLARVPGVRQLNLLPYHNAAEDKHNRWSKPYELKGLHAPTENALQNAAKLLETYGLKITIGG